MTASAEALGLNLSADGSSQSISSDLERRTPLTGHDDERLAGRIRDLETALAEKDRLLGELRHQIKNHLQLMANVVAAQSDRALSVESRQELDDVRGRLEALGAVYQGLHGDDNGLADLSQVFRAIATDLAALYDPNDSIELVVDTVSMSVNAAVGSSLGLVLHELLTNTFKHAFVGRSSGRLVLSLKRHEDELLLSVEDDGSATRADDVEGLGIPILTSLVRQLGGRLEYRNDQGYDAFIYLPPTILSERREDI